MKTLRKTKRMRKHTLALLTVMVMLMATLLTACGSNQAVAPSTEAETTKVETAKTEETEPVAPVETEEVVESTTEEPALTPEPVVYEGIDMESTLSGEEWVKTFDGVIEEPKMVIFNDETNKKVIVENGQEVAISSKDTFGIFYPTDKKVVISIFDNNHLFCNVDSTEYANFYYNLFPGYNEGDKVDVSQKIEVDGEEMELKATLVIKND